MPPRSAAVKPSLCSSVGPNVNVPSGSLGPTSQEATCGPSFSVPPPAAVPSAQRCSFSTSSAGPSVKVPYGLLGPASQVATCGQPRHAASSVGSAVGGKAPPECRHPEVAALLLLFTAVVNTSKSLPAVSHDVLHFITNAGPPIASKFRRLDGEKLSAAKAEFAILEREGVIRRSSSPWSSPLHMVRKKDGGWRPCGDFRRLNLVTVPDTYPLPNMMDFTSRLAG